MKNFDFDAMAKTRVSPVTFTLRGKKYKVEIMGPDRVDEIAELMEEREETGATTDEIQSETLALLTGAKVDEFNGIPVAQFGMMLESIFDGLKAGSKRRGQGKKPRS